MYCPVCGKDMPTHAEMRGAMTNKLEEPAGLVVLCSKGHVIPEQVDDLSGFVDGDGNPADDAPVQFTPPGRPISRKGAAIATPPAKPAPVARPSAAKAASVAARDALKTIKARRREIRAEVKRLEALRLEDDELAAAEAAIEAARRAKKVRPIREAAS